MKLLTKEQQESHENGKTCYIRKEKRENKYVIDKQYSKGREIIAIIQENIGALCIAYVI